MIEKGAPEPAGKTPLRHNRQQLISEAITEVLWRHNTQIRQVKTVVIFTVSDLHLI